MSSLPDISMKREVYEAIRKHCRSEGVPSMRQFMDDLIGSGLDAIERRKTDRRALIKERNETTDIPSELPGETPKMPRECSPTPSSGVFKRIRAARDSRS